MNQSKTDWFLIVWTIELFLWDSLVMGTTTYLVFWQGHSGWWYALAILMCLQTTYFDVIKKKYGLKLTGSNKGQLK